MQTNTKITRKDLMNILNVSYDTAKREYRTILDSLAVKRTYLTANDLKTYGI